MQHTQALVLKVSLVVVVVTLAMHADQLQEELSDSCTLAIGHSTWPANQASMAQSMHPALFTYAIACDAQVTPEEGRSHAKVSCQLVEWPNQPECCSMTWPKGIGIP